LNGYDDEGKIVGNYANSQLAKMEASTLATMKQLCWMSRERRGRLGRKHLHCRRGELKTPPLLNS